MPYIPQFNKLSFQEQAYAPTLMRQQHDDAVAKQMELADALKFDYLKQDASILEPVLSKYSEDINKVSTDLAKQGFTQDTKSKLLGLRSQYTSDDKIRQVKKNYSDAMSQWDEQRKRMIQEGRPGDEINKQKNAFFSGYQGAFSDDGFKNDFTAGATSGSYKIGDYALKAADKLGHTGATINGGKDKLIPIKLPDGGTAYEVRNVSDGKLITNLSQVDAIKKYVTDQFNTKGTDENLYANIVGLTPDYINSTIDNVLNSQLINDRTAPKTNSSYTGFSSGVSKPKKEIGFSTYNPITGNPGAKQQIDENVSSVMAGIKGGKFDPQNIPEDRKGVIRDIKNAGYFYGNVLADVAQGGLDFTKGFLGMKHDELGKPYFEKNQESLKTTTRDYATKMFNKTKEKYQVAYDQIKRNGGNDQDFISQVAKYEENTSANLGRRVGLNFPDAIKSIYGKINEAQKAFVDEDGNQLTRAQIDKKVKDAGLSREEFFNRQTFVDSRGQMYFQLPKKEGSDEIVEYAVNPEAMPEETKTNKKTLDVLESSLTNFQLTPAQLEKVSRTPFEVGGHTFKVVIDPQRRNDKFDRILVLVNEDGSLTDENGNYNRVPLSAIQSLNTSDILTGIKTSN